MIGNSTYSGGGQLKNPVNDARGMAQVLTELKFEVLLKIDVKQSEMITSIRDFTARLGPGSVGLFFYAGHGVQIEGLNYLLPTDYDERGIDEFSVKRASVRVDDDILRSMEKSSARLSLVILDACRNNPFQAGRGRSVSGGLAPMDPARGSAILFAAAAGQQADDNPAENNGAFTKQLMETLREPGLSLGEITEAVTERVDRVTNGQQQPAYYTQVVGRFVLNPGNGLEPDRRAGVSTPAAPEITDLTADQLEVASSEAATLRVSASDPNAEPLQFSWAVNGGTIEGRGASAVFSPGSAVTARGLSSVTVTVTARNQRGLETRKSIVLRLKAPTQAAPTEVRGRVISLGQNVDVWLEQGAPNRGAGESGTIQADLEAIDTVWHVARVQGSFPGTSVTTVGECRNCTLVSVTEPPGRANGFLRARLRVRPIDPRQAMTVLLRYQPSNTKKK